jgi:hypothetical protein
VFVAPRRAEDDEIGFQEIFELGILVELLTQQYTPSSATAEEVDQDLLVFGLGLSQGLVECTLEKHLGGG